MTQSRRLTDPAAIEQALRLILADGQVTELRALDATMPGVSYPATISGYFDDPAKLAAEAARIVSAKGIYFVPNPVDPALLARAVNRIRKTPRGESTSDRDVAARHWLLIDCDAVRPAGISATDAEHEAAIDRARAVYSHLKALGWPDPIVADSGNGAHLFYRIDLLADDGGLVQRCLEALSQRFSDEAIKIDTSVHNPARIWKLYGTLACKGDSTDDRPHRMSRVLSTPETIEIVPVELLEALAAEAEPSKPARSGHHADNGRHGTFSIEDFITRHNLDVDGPHPWQGGRRWTLRTSPMCDHHNDGPFIVVFPGGPLSSGCHHDSCKGRWGWRELRERLEPAAKRQGQRQHARHADTDQDDDDAALPIDDPWPEPMDDAAFHGLAGDLVRTIEPHSEADPVALLVQTLVAFGNVVDRKPHFTAEADRHGCNLFACLVGRTSKGRKGTSWGHVRTLVGAADPTWRDDRVQGGLSSGEGMIWAVRDPIFKREKQKGGGYDEVLADPGVDDKRLVCVEPEFGGVLRVIARERNTLSAIVRQAWDSGMLRTMTKNSPAKATDAHISVIGHVTRDELRQEITTIDLAGGFANRFLWVCVQRSKCLPEGGTLHAVDMGSIVKRLTEAVNFAREVGPVTRNAEARELWASVYPELSEGKPGLLGAATGRAEAITMRLAMIYALLDGSAVIRPEHLTAALAVWTYAEASARYAFGAALGNPTADEILRALRQAAPQGLTRSEISRDVLQRNTPAALVRSALAALLEAKLVRFAAEDTGGRPAQVWYSV